MDPPCSHSTSDLTLRSALADFDAHPKLPLLVTAYLALRRREAREQGHTATADTLLRLAASKAAGDMVVELSRRVRNRNSPRFRDFRHATSLVGLWRDPSTRPELRRLVRDDLATRPSGFTWRQMRAGLKWAAAHERDHREFLIAFLLERLAVLATQPDEPTRREIEMHKVEFAEQRDAAELLRASGFPGQAAAHTTRAVFHLCRAQNLAREWTPDPRALIREVLRGGLSWQIGFLGYKTAAKLVAVAVDRHVTRRMARYAFKIPPK